MKMRLAMAAGATALSLLVTNALAERSFDMAGTGTAQNNSIVMPIEGGPVMVGVSSEYTGLETVDPAHPLNGARGPCRGALMIKPPTIEGNGNCFYTDKDGDVAALVWTARELHEGGANSGDWSVVGGTGKYVGASGGGTYLAVTDPETRIQTNTVTGEMILK